MNPLYSIAEIRAIEQCAAQQLPPGTLMQCAGHAAAKAALDLLKSRPGPANAKVLLLVGPGNNGGDALEAALYLVQAGVQVSVWQVCTVSHASPERQHALKRAENSAIKFIDTALKENWSLVIDGLFGIGLQRPLEGAMRQAIDMVNHMSKRLACPVLALDVPSGLDADTGAIVGPDGVAVRATHTITFIGDKPGLHTCDGQDCAGIVQVATLDIDIQHIQPAKAHLNEVSHFSPYLRARRHNTHKGSYGDLAIIGGAHGMTGAPILAARAALFCGAGRVYIAFMDKAPAYDGAQPELMCRSTDDMDFNAKALVAGPGLGTTPRARDVLLRAIDSTSALLLDADALNLMAVEPGLQTALAQRNNITVLTPHPLEAARLLGMTPGEVQADRLAAARRLAAKMQATVVLKGSGTVIAAADGRVIINTTGNPALATAGTGDVLSGLCGSLLAQGWPEWEAALAAVWLHGMAADTLVKDDGVGPIGLTAGELIPAIRVAFNRAVHASAAA